MIAVRDLVKNYQDNDNLICALNNVSFEIKRGDFVAIMGPSGSGKSTLLNILSFLDRPTRGQYLLAGQNIADLNDNQLAGIRNKEMGFVFQSFNLLANATVYQNVEIPLLYSDVRETARAGLIKEAVASVNLTDKLYVKANKLSGGQKQRVAIARALVNSPNVIFADEPTGNLDSQSGSQVMRILEKLHKSGKTVILVTHESDTARFADRLIILKDGSIESDHPVIKPAVPEEFSK